ncbi:hypothetical protein R2R70_17400 [Cobetia sp. SIMBA_158]|uniref:hypothetical protein n=2 Tax=Gammaproteobacteria TaxID=1236 RepID=UPI00397F609B
MHSSFHEVRAISMQESKSKSFLLFWGCYVIGSILILYFCVNYGVNGSYIEGIAVFLFSMLLISMLYWYLRVKPSNSYVASDDPRDELIKVNSQLGDMEDIIEAIEFFKRNGDELDEASNENKFIVDYISIRSEVLSKKDRLIHNVEDLYNAAKLSSFESTLERDIKKLSEKRLAIEDKLQSRTADDIEDDSSLDKMRLLIKVMTSRLENEITQLSRRGDIYIIIGSVLTIAAGYILYLSMGGLQYSGNDVRGVYALGFTKHELLVMSVKISIVFFVEIFAFYYLRLYREIIKDVKYYRNEITNIEARLLALYAIDSSKQSEALNGLVDELSKVERNFVIDKKHTTVELEKSKHDSNVMVSAIEKVTKLINTAKA